MEIPFIQFKKPGIYCIKNIVNGKVYVGSSSNIRQRLSRHNSSLKYNKHKNSHLQASYDKYGDSNFEFIILEIIDNVENLANREQYYINFYHSTNREFGYNLIINAIRGTHSLETKLKISQKNKGKKRSLEHRERMKTYMPRGENHSRYGVKWTEEERRQISLRQRGSLAPNYGRVFGAETRKKQSDFRKGKTHNHAFCRPILQFSLDGNLLNRFESFKEIFEKFGSVSGVKRACKNNGGKSIGFQWMYASSKLGKK